MTNEMLNQCVESTHNSNSLNTHVHASKPGAGPDSGSVAACSAACFSDSKSNDSDAVNAAHMDTPMWLSHDEHNQMMPMHIRSFLDDPDLETPVLAVDVAQVRQNFAELRCALPTARVFYAIKANPEPEILIALAELGSCFDVASPTEVDMALATGVCPSRVSYGNTIKKEKAIAYAFSKGVRLFAFDSQEELEKLARAAPGASVFCRILLPDSQSADWPLSRKFGCHPTMAEDLLVQASELGLQAVGVSFHVGSQQTDPTAWEPALRDVSAIFQRNSSLTLVNLGGGLPTRYAHNVSHINEYGSNIMESLKSHFPTVPDLIIEPGRSIAGNAGVIESEVVLVSRKELAADSKRWVYLDIGLFSGLAETMGECIKYRIACGSPDTALGAVVLAGPTCDSADIMYEHTRFEMPLSLKAGDHVRILGTGAYTQTYSSVSFNGFSPLRAVCIDSPDAKAQIAQLQSVLSKLHVESTQPHIAAALTTTTTRNMSLNEQQQQLLQPQQLLLHPLSTIPGSGPVTGVASTVLR
jgi:ornithine decarboxylase